MATNKPRFSITLDEELFKRVNEYHHKKRYATQTKTIVDLIQRGAKSLGIVLADVKPKKSPPARPKPRQGKGLFRWKSQTSC